jgi:phosphorylated CTD-interacting factor 1
VCFLLSPFISLLFVHIGFLRFNQKQHLVPAFEHEYRSGHQHNTNSDEEVLYRAVHGTLIFFLQNDAGFEAWGPTDKRVAALTKAFKRQ